MVLKRLQLKKLIPEIIWIIAACCGALVLSYLLTSYFSSVNDFNFHDTYFVIDVKSSTFFYFGHILFILLFLIYGVKEAFRKYKSIPGNIVLIIASVGLLISQTYLFLVMVYIFYHFTNTSSPTEHGWTVYPPLSANEVYTSNGNPPTIDAVSSILQYTLFPVVIAMLIFVSIKTGKLISKKTNS